MENVSPLAPPTTATKGGGIRWQGRGEVSVFRPGLGSGQNSSFRPGRWTLGNNGHLYVVEDSRTMPNGCLKLDRLVKEIHPFPKRAPVGRQFSLSFIDGSSANIKFNAKDDGCNVDELWSALIDMQNRVKQQQRQAPPPPPVVEEGGRKQPSVPKNGNSSGGGSMRPSGLIQSKVKTIATNDAAAAAAVRSPPTQQPPKTRAQELLSSFAFDESPRQSSSSSSAQQSAANRRLPPIPPLQQRRQAADDKENSRPMAASGALRNGLPTGAFDGAAENSSSRARETVFPAADDKVTVRERKRRPVQSLLHDHDRQQQGGWAPPILRKMPSVGVGLRSLQTFDQSDFDDYERGRSTKDDDWGYETTPSSSSSLLRQGFSNLGNTCYMNAILQAMFGVSPFTDALKAAVADQLLSALDAQPQPSLIRALAAMASARTLAGTTSADRRALLENVKAAIANDTLRDSTKQEDAQEFLASVLNQVKEEYAKAVRASKTGNNAANPTGATFTFTLHRRLRCERCGNVVTKDEDFVDFPVHVRLPSQRQQPSDESSASSSVDVDNWRSLQTLLEETLADEEVEYRCEREQCRHNVSLYRLRFLGQGPRCLIVYAKRALYRLNRGGQKIGAPVDIPRFLTLDGLCAYGESDAADDDDDGGDSITICSNSTIVLSSSLSEPSKTMEEDEEKEESAMDVDDSSEVENNSVVGESNGIDVDRRSAAADEEEEGEEDRDEEGQRTPAGDEGAVKVQAEAALVAIRRQLSLRFSPVDDEWRRDKCRRMELKMVDEEDGDEEQPSTSPSTTVSKRMSYVDRPKLVAEIEKDGNCFFRALSFVLTGGDQHGGHEALRQQISFFLSLHAEVFRRLDGRSEADWAEYVERMAVDGVWASAMELSAAATLLQTDVWTYYQRRWHLYQPRFATDDQGLALEDAAADEEKKTKKFPSSSTSATDEARPGIYLRNEGDHFEPVISVTDKVYKTELQRRRYEKLRKNAEEGAMKPAYRLTAVVSHVGTSSGSGHYICDVRDDESGAWRSCDDSQVTAISEAEVRQERRRTGYIFLYRRIENEDEEEEKKGAKRD